MHIQKLRPGQARPGSLSAAAARGPCCNEAVPSTATRPTT